MKTTLAILFLLTVGSAFAANVKPPAQVITRGIPPIPAELAKAVQPYLAARAIRLQDWHPVKEHVLITQRPQGGQVPQLHLVEGPKGMPKQLTRGTGPVREAKFQPADGRSVIFLRDEGGSERYQVFHLDLTSGKTARITDGKNRHTGARWSPDGKSIAYFSPKRNGRDNDLYMADPTQPGSEKLLAKLSGGGWWISDWAANPDIMMLVEYLSINHSRLHIVDAKTGTLSQFSPKLNTPVSYRNARFAPAMRAVFYTCDADADFHHIVRFDFQTGDRQRLLGDVKWDVEAFELAPNGRTIAVVHNTGGYSQLRLINSADGKTLPASTFIPSNRIGIIRSLQWHRKNDGLIYDYEWALSPGLIRSIRIGAKEPTNWATSDTAKLDLDHIAIPRLLTLRSVDGVQFDSVVYIAGKTVNGTFRPKFTSRPRPVLVLFHGGPESQFRPRYMGQLNYLINELGIALICPNVRGSRGYGKKFLKLDNGTARAGVVRDIQRLRNDIAENTSFDADRIAVMGGSYGGFMALHSMVTLNSFLKCGIDIVGISNFNTFLKNTSDYRRDLRRAEYGDERDPKMRKFLEDISPLTHVEQITRPLLIVQGANDPRVPATESAQMEKALRAKGIPTWYLLAKDEGHGFRKQINRKYQFLATIEFLRRHLLDEK